MSSLDLSLQLSHKVQFIKRKIAHANCLILMIKIMHIHFIVRKKNKGEKLKSGKVSVWWYNRLSHGLRCLHPLWYCWYESLWILFPPSFLLMGLGRWCKCIGSYYPHRKPTWSWSFWLLTWVWSNPGYCGHWQTEPADGSSLSLCPPLPLYHSVFHINKYTNNELLLKIGKKISHTNLSRKMAISTFV